MRRLLVKLWRDDGGALIASEWVFVATILVIGSITGLVAVRDAVATELTEFANALTTLSQGYSFSGLQGCNARTDGSEADDSPSRKNLTSIAESSSQLVDVTIDCRFGTTSD